SENLIGRGLGSKEIYKYPSLRVTPLVGQESHHFPAMEEMDHILHDALVRKGLDSSVFPCPTEKVAGKKRVLKACDDHVQPDPQEFHCGRADFKAAEMRVQKADAVISRHHG